mmetsp:Transcript_5701/g.7666  ORF Transcript_5701/g.7666 Transcript_5701/m.7666 type:complete len:227 (+) Transcript_5701:700-1380(+)
MDWHLRLVSLPTMSPIAHSAHSCQDSPNKRETTSWCAASGVISSRAPMCLSARRSGKSQKIPCSASRSTSSKSILRRISLCSTCRITSRFWRTKSSTTSHSQGSSRSRNRLMRQLTARPPRRRKRRRLKRSKKRNLLTRPLATKWSTSSNKKARALILRASKRVTLARARSRRAIASCSRVLSSSRLSSIWSVSQTCARWARRGSSKDCSTSVYSRCTQLIRSLPR